MGHGDLLRLELPILICSRKTLLLVLKDQFSKMLSNIFLLNLTYLVFTAKNVDEFAFAKSLLHW